ncbi:MAG: O-antigen ligase family protein [Planctomycetota bacterium]
MLLRSHIIGVQPRTGGELTAESALAALVVAGPLMFGATEAWSFQILLSLAGVAFLGACVDLALHRDKPMRWSWSFVPIVAFLALIVVQLVPLPAGLVGTIAPQVATFWQAAGVDGAITLSVYPFETQRQLWLMLVVAAVFFTVVQTHRRPEQVQLLLMAIVIGGGLAVALALGQNIVGSRVAWGISPNGTTVSAQYLHPFSGPFLNHSHFSQLANLTIGACFALLLVQLNEILDGGSRRVWTRVSDIVRHPQLRLGRVVTVVALASAVAIVLSLSRGGVLSMAVALGVTVCALALSSRRRGAGTFATLFGIVVLVLLLGLGVDVAAQRLSTLRDFQEASGGRMQIVMDVIAAVRGFPVTGAGLGSFGVAYPAFDSTGSAAVATHAENEYAQLLFETGLIGVGCLLAFVAFLLVAAWHCVSSVAKFRDAPIIRYAAYGIGYGLIAVAVHSLSDFGQHVPGIAVVTASMAGLLVALPKVRRSEKYGVRRDAKLVIPVRWAALLVGVGVVGWMWWGIEQDRRARAILEKATMLYVADLDAEEPLVADRAYAALILAGEKARATTPGDAQLAFRLARLRYDALRRTVTDAGLANHADTLGRIATDLRAAHRLAPTYGPPLAVAGGIERFILNDEAGGDAIRRARELTAYDAETHFVDARLTLFEGDEQAALERFDRAVALEPGRRPDVIDVMVSAGELEFAYRYAEGDGSLLEHLARRLEAQDEVSAASLELVRRARLEALALLRAEVSSGNASGRKLLQLAEVEWTAGDHSAALDLMSRAVSREPTNARWRMRYATMLFEQGRYDNAVEQLKLLLRFKPDDRRAADLLEEANRALILQKADARRERREAENAPSTGDEPASD